MPALMPWGSFDMRAGRWLCALHTIRHLRPRQALYYVWRRGLGPRRIAPSTLPPRQRGSTFSASVQHREAAAPGDHYRFHFLNRTLTFPPTAMDWQPRAVNRLWRYHLHYFGFLGEGDRSLAEKGELLDDWIRQNPLGTEPAWEPYTASLRIVNWCKFLWTLPAGQQRGRWLASLFDQARWLERNIEYHILANHLFENLKALVFAGAYFDGARAKHWLQFGQRELRKQLREQNLSDGGHYERSPLYHCVLLEGCLDLLNLGLANPGLLNRDLQADLSAAISRNLAWLERIKTPDDSIPLFNDSAENAALRPSRLIAYAGRLGLRCGGSDAGAGQLIELPATGIYGWKNARHYFAIDCGDIGPAYQPGHTHCDFLSYVWMVDNQWIVVDSGVGEYEPGELRRYARSTASHNTVCVDGAEQSELWGAFRVGRRAVKLEARIAQRATGIRFDGAFRGFPTLGGLLHRRHAELLLDRQEHVTALRITDRVVGSGNRIVDSYIHLHPSIEVEPIEGGMTLKRGNTALAQLKADSAQAIDAIDRLHCVEFGKCLKNKAIRLRRRGPLPLTINYVITLMDAIGS